MLVSGNRRVTELRPSRRSVLTWSTIAAGAAGLTTLAERGAPHATADAAGDPSDITTVWNACTVNCHSRCPVRVQVKDGVAVRILPDNRGDDSTLGMHNILACVRGRSIRRRAYSPDRLKRPMKRREGTQRGDGEWEEISWEQAFDEIAARLRDTINTYGNEALYANAGTGTNGGNIIHNRLVKRFFEAVGGSLQNLRNYSFPALTQATKYQFGDGGVKTNSTHDAVNTQLQVLFGENYISNRMSGGGEMYTRQQTKKATGHKTIVIDPRYTDTAQNIGDEWIPIRPGTDAALIASMIHVMVDEALHDQEFLDRYCVGFDEATLPPGAPPNSSYRSYIEGRGPDGVDKTPEWAADITGIPATTIRRLAREIATTKPCAISSGWGLQRQANGENQTRAIYTLAAVTGNIGISGGGTGGYPATLANPIVDLPAIEPQITAAIPVFKWSDAVDRGAELTAIRDGVENADRLHQPIKFMINFASQLLLNQHADLNRIVELLRDDTKLETLVVIDTHMTPAARYADYLLPDAMSLEQDDLVRSHDCGDQGFAIYAQAAITPPGEAMSVYDMFVGILDSLDPSMSYRFTEGRTQKEWVSEIYRLSRDEHPELPEEEEFARQGVYQYMNRNGYTVPLKDFREDPDAHPLDTPSGKIEIYSATLADMAQTWEFPKPEKGERITALPEYVETWEGVEDARASTEFPLQVTSYHMKGRTHSSYGNVDWLKEAHPDHVWINPIDARARGIETDDTIEISGKRGKIISTAFVTERMMPGVIAVPEGGWYTPDENGVDQGGCISTLTSLTPTPLAKGNAQMTIIGEVRRVT